MRKLILRFDLPALPDLDATELVRSMAYDKKAREAGLTWILPRGIGAAEPVPDIGEEEVRRELEAFLQDPRAPV